MKVTDAGDRIFTCSKNEDGKMSLTCEGTGFGINFAFSPPVPNTFTEDDDSGTLEFTVVRETDLIINFNYSSQSGGKYRTGLMEIEEDPDGTFSESVKQFGALPQRRTYTFLLED